MGRGSSLAMMLKSIFVVSALLSVILFPWQITLLVSAIGSVFVPPLAVVIGMLADVLYGHTGSPYLGTDIGLALSVGGFFVHQFLKTRIMSA
jgi:hypothetical protein